eukprot:m.171554 g.171554  ORF g.171554 m.171554 type:complete len:101 (+) comp39058_c0_seq10:949-1251(+)
MPQHNTSIWWPVSESGGMNVNESCALPGLSPVAVTYIVTGSVEMTTSKLQFEDLCDPDLRETIEQVINAQSKENLQASITDALLQLLDSSRWRTDHVLHT